MLLTACAGAGTTAVSAPGTSSGGESTADRKPRPNTDLAAELVRYYPLRGFVLSEGGAARVRFTVSARGTVTTGETISATREEYAEACGQMLRASTWTPAQKAGQPVEFSSVFDCLFEHEAQLAARGTVGTQAVVPPEPPDYGKAWYERYGEEYVTHDTGAQLRIALDTRGAVRVIGVEPGSDPAAAHACSEMLEHGPPWTPAKDEAGDAVAFEGVFKCRVELRSRRKELHVNAVSSLGPITPAQVSAALADRFAALVHCYETAMDLDKPLQGLHWLAFEITPAGEVGRVEWIERVYSDEAIDACVQRAVRGMRFGPATDRTIADAQLYIGGLSSMVSDVPSGTSQSTPRATPTR